MWSSNRICTGFATVHGSDRGACMVRSSTEQPIDTTPGQPATTRAFDIHIALHLAHRIAQKSDGRCMIHAPWLQRIRRRQLIMHIGPASLARWGANELAAEGDDRGRLGGGDGRQLIPAARAVSVTTITTRKLFRTGDRWPSTDMPYSRRFRGHTLRGTFDVPWCSMSERRLLPTETAWCRWPVERSIRCATPVRTRSIKLSRRH